MRATAWPQDAHRSVSASALTFALWLALSGATASAQSIVIGRADAQPGQRVSVQVVLNSAGQQIAGTENDISFDPSAPIAATASGAPDCRRNVAIDKGGTAFSFRPNGCFESETCTGVRAIVFALDNSDPIPSGSVLYTCDIAVAENADGTYPLSCSAPLGSRPDGGAVSLSCTDGLVAVSGAAPTSTPVPTATPETAPCLGDGDGDRQVSISELIKVVGNSLHGCR
jgi:hypothetical protein